MKGKSKEIKYPQLGANLRWLRLKKRLTQEGFAKEIGVTRSAYIMWEGGISRPNPVDEKAIAVFYHISVDSLYNNDLKKDYPVNSTFNDDNDVVVPVYGDTGALATPEMAGVSDASAMPTEYRKLARSLFDDAKAILPVFGNSMTPGYPPSTELALAPDNSGYIEYGEVYVLELHGSDIPIFKRVLPSAVPGEVILASDNEMIRESGPFRGDYYYPPQPIKLELVKQWWVVLGDQKRRKNKQIILRNLRENQTR